MNRNEKGQISPAQSKIAKQMRPKLKVIARGQKDAYRKNWLKGYSAVRKGKG